MGKLLQSPMIIKFAANFGLPIVGYVWGKKSLAWHMQSSHM